MAIIQIVQGYKISKRRSRPEAGELARRTRKSASLVANQRAGERRQSDHHPRACKKSISSLIQKVARIQLKGSSCLDRCSAAVSGEAQNPGSPGFRAQPASKSPMNGRRKRFLTLRILMNSLNICRNARLLTCKESTSFSRACRALVVFSRSSLSLGISWYSTQPNILHSCHECDMLPDNLVESTKIGYIWKSVIYAAKAHKAMFVCQRRHATSAEIDFAVKPFTASLENLTTYTQSGPKHRTNPELVPSAPRQKIQFFHIEKASIIP